MSDLHSLPLRGHDIEFRPYVRAKVYRLLPDMWMWAYTSGEPYPHGPFRTWEQAMRSALRMLEEC